MYVTRRPGIVPSQVILYTFGKVQGPRWRGSMCLRIPSTGYFIETLEPQRMSVIGSATLRYQQLRRLFKGRVHQNDFT